MKSTDSFKQIISDKLDVMAAADSIFCEKMKAEGKSLDLCITYILNTVQKSGCAGFSDDEVYGMAAHYYDEEKIDVGKPIKCNVVVNHAVEKKVNAEFSPNDLLTDDDIKTAKEIAMENAIAEERERLRKKTITKKPDSSINQGSLF